MNENYNTIVKLIKDIDFQKTQLLYNLEEMFNFDKMDDLSYDLNPFCNDIYFYTGEYEIDIIETKEEYPDYILFNELESGNQLIETPIFQCCERMVKNDSYVALMNDDNNWLILNISEGKFNKL